jgi:hypothetical protein
MGKRFLLFGEKPFDAYALEKFSAVASDIERLSDIEVIMYKECFDELVQKLVDAYVFRSLEISFENKMVDLINRPNEKQARIFAEYSMIVSGNAYFLGLVPYHQAPRNLSLPVSVTGNVLAFEIDTRGEDEELSPASVAHVKREYQKIKKFIDDSVYNMNRTILYYNAELEKFVVPLLANKLRKADKCLKVKESLNFK